MDVANPKCRFPNCSTTPSFAPSSQRVPLYCAAHRAPTHESKRKGYHRKCQHPEGCSKHPVFGILGTRTTLLCRAHRLAGMVDVVSPRCSLGRGCERIASFGDAQRRRSTACVEHKTAGMIHLKAGNARAANCTTSTGPSTLKNAHVHTNDGRTGRRPSRVAKGRLSAAPAQRVAARLLVRPPPPHPPPPRLDGTQLELQGDKSMEARVEERGASADAVQRLARRGPREREVSGAVQAQGATPNPPCLASASLWLLPRRGVGRDLCVRPLF